MRATSNLKILIKKHIIGGKYEGFLKWFYRYYKILFNVKLIPGMFTREKILLVFLDFQVFPYDFSAWVLLQNLHFEMQRIGCARFDLILINDRLRDRRSDQDFINDEFSDVLIQNMVIDGLVMIPGLRNTYYFKLRWQAFLFYIRNFYGNIFPNGYNIIYPCTDNVNYGKYTQIQLIDHNRKITYFKPNKMSIYHVEKWLKMNDLIDDKIVTITIRNTQITYRNSKINEWAAAAKYLSKKYDIFFVVIPDYYDIYDSSCYELFSGVAVICNEAAASIRFRMALYYKAILNMSVECGVNVLSMYLGRPHIEFKKIQTDENVIYNNRLHKGESWAHFNEMQKNVWGDDVSENIITEAEVILDKIFSRPPVYSKPSCENISSTISSIVPKNLVAEKKV